MRNPNRERIVLLLATAISVLVIAGCGAAARTRHDPFFDDDASPITGDLDDAEERWRKEIETERATDPDALLTDDPPGEPERYGKVAFGDIPPPRTVWGKMKAGAETVGKASFAAMAVLMTLGMMAAPYLLL